MAQPKALTRTEQRIARGFGGWMLANLILYPDAKFTHEGGRSIPESLRPFADKGQTQLYHNSKGLWFGWDRSGPPVLKWDSVRAHARTLDTDLIDRLKANMKERHAHQSTYRTFTAPAEAVGCGPIPGMGPLTKVQQTYIDAHQEWVENMLKPYSDLKRIYDDDMEALLDEAFPLASGLCGCAAMRLPHLFSEGTCEVAA